ncbi:MAG: anti-sigma factor [Nocardioides sp.]|nr:anti-sigma factor [Nocardioides sp.]
MSTDVHTLSGAYAVDALDPREAAEFEEHLEQCHACREEVAELQHAAALMGAAEAAAAPAALRSRVLDEVERAPQLPPRVASLPSDPVTVPGSVVPLRRRLPARGLLAAAAAVVALAIGGVLVSDTMRDDGVPLAGGVVQVFEADDARSVTVDTSNGGKVRVALSAAEGQMAVDTAQLPDLGPRQVYQLWTVVGDIAQPAGVLDDPKTGASMGLPAEGTKVAITIEPMGGSERPTSAPIVTVDPADV